MQDAIIGSENGDDYFTVFWKARPWPRAPWDNSTEPIQPEEQRTVQRSEVISHDGVRCGNLFAQAPVVTATASAEVIAENSEPSRSDDEEAGKPRYFNLTIELSSVTCCGLRALRQKSSPDEAADQAPPVTRNRSVIEFERLLTPLVGRRMRMISGWWTYELCWPWYIRMFHQSIHGEVEGPSLLLGKFDPDGLVLQRAPPRQEGQRYELITDTVGGSCGQTVQKWSVSRSGEADIPGVRSSFNPTSGGNVEGRLSQSATNTHGCTLFEERFDGFILLVKRGKCWFHTKAVNAQAAGAIGVIVYNDQVHMVDVMEGVDELPSPMIPTVLVEQERGARLLELVGTQVSIAKADVAGVDTERPIATKVVFRCSAEWHERHAACLLGDEVDVKVPPPEGHAPGSRWPQSAVRIQKATLDAFDDDNMTVQVTWLASAEGGEEVNTGDLPASIPLSWAYYEGNPCNSLGSSRIELISEPQTCHTEFVIHVPELCAHPRLAPPQQREAQVISCSADSSAREAISTQRAVHEAQGNETGEQQKEQEKEKEEDLVN